MRLVRAVPRRAPRRPGAIVQDVVLVVASAVGIWVIGGELRRVWREPPKRRDTREAIHALAHEAFPAWRTAHPDRECPGSLEELASFARHRGTSDGWLEPLRFLCGHGRIVVLSTGADGTPGTADDVWSAR